MMAKLDALMLKLYCKMVCAVEDTRTSEDGDTNFISIMVILGIVVVLAGLFMTLGKDVIKEVETIIKDFLKGLK